MDKIIDLMKKFCEEEESCRFYEGYSGRGMLGNKCPGIVTEDPDVYMTIVKLCDFLHDNEEFKSNFYGVSEAITSIRIDDLGMDTIIYFPEIRM